MARLALFCVVLLLAVGSVQGASAVAAAIAALKQLLTMELQLLPCIVQIFRTLTSSHTCNFASVTNPQIKPNSFPSIEATLKAAFGNLTCNQTNPNNLKSCGNGWLYDGTWCYCKGAIKCSASAATTAAPTTTPTTTKATTTVTTTKATTQPTTQATTKATTQPTTQATTKAPAVTTPPAQTVPIIMAAIPAIGSLLTATALLPIPITLTVTGNPQPTVTVSKGTYSYTLTSLPASVLNTYVYTGAIPAADFTDAGTWTITASNGIGQPTISTFNVAINYQNYSVSTGPNPTPILIPLSSNGSVAIQLNSCTNLWISFCPLAFDGSMYNVGRYSRLDFGAGGSTFADVYYYQYLNPNVQPYPAACPPEGQTSATPFWLLMDVTQSGTTLTVGIWSSPSQQDLTTFTMENTRYQVDQIGIDLSGPGVPLNIVTYP